MNKKKEVKKLMALGIQRNDAAAFIRTYRKLISTGNASAIPTMLMPVPEVKVQNYDVRKIRSQYRFYRRDVYPGAEDRARNIVVDQLLRFIKNQNVIEFTSRYIPDNDEIEINGTISYIPPYRR